MKRIITIIFFALIVFSLCYAKGSAITVACIPPEGNMDSKDKDIFVSSVEAAFIKKGYTVVDRQRMEQLTKEILLQNSGMVDETVAVEAGKLLKVDYLVAIKLNSSDTTQLLLAKKAQEAVNKRGARLDYSKMTIDSRGRDLISATWEVVRLDIDMLQVENGAKVVVASETGVKTGTSSTQTATKIVKNIDKQLKKLLKENKK